MAIFNPQTQPTNDPNYLGYSRGIEGGFGVDKSTGIGIETAAKALEDGVTIVDTGIKDYLKDSVRKTVEKQRDDYTQYLTTLKQIAQTHAIPGAGPTDSIMDANASMDVPEGLQAGLDRAKSLAAASNTGNRINDTLYTANLASAASELRTKWSGYKDYIDQKFSEYSGMNPANAYYKNLMQDINTLAANKNKDSTGAKAIIADAVRSGDVPDADKIWSLNKAINPQTGQPYMSDDEAIHQVFKAREAKAKTVAMEAARVARKGDRDDTVATATRDFSQEVAGSLNNKMALLQVGTGGQTLKGQVEWLTKAGLNPDKVNPKDIQTAVTGLDAAYNTLFNDFMARAAERDSTGQSYITRMGGVNKVKEEIEGNLSGLKQYRDSVNEGKFGLGTYIQRSIKAQSEADQQDLLQDPELRRSKAIQDAFPTYGDVFLKAGLLGNVPERLSNYLNGKRIDALTQPNAANGQPSTLKKDINEIDTKISNNPKYSPTDVAKLKNEVFNIPKTIADPKAPIEAKANIARHAFDPQNIGILQGIKMDYTDPQTGKYVPGKYSVFTRMTSPDITDNMDVIRKAGLDGPQLWDNYKNWTQTEFQKLFREDLSNLNGLNDTRLHIGWTSGEGGQPPRMKVLNEQGHELVGPPPTPSMAQAQRTVQRINSAMYNLHQVYRKDGEDTNMPILQDILQNWTPTEKTQGLPAKVMDAIILANKSKLQKMEDTFFQEKPSEGRPSTRLLFPPVGSPK